MADTDTDQAPATPAPATTDPDLINKYLALLQQGPPNIQPDQTPVDTSGFWGGLRHGVSLLGEALGGGKGSPGYAALSPTEREYAGSKALGDFGTQLMAASRYQPGQTIFSNLAQGFQGAEQSYRGTEQDAAGMLAARQAYANEQQTNQLARIKEALPLLQMQARLKAAAGLQNPLAPSPAPGGGGNIATGGSISPFIATNLPNGVSTAEDQMVRTIKGEAGNQGTVGQQAVAAVIKNRMDAGGQNAQDVIFARNQFEPWNNTKVRADLEKMDPNSAEYQSILNNAVRPIMSGTAKDPTGGATYFYSPSAQAQLSKSDGRALVPSWAAGQTPSQVIGAHNFYKLPYSPQAPAPGQTAAATPPPPNPAQPSAAVPGQPVPPAPVGQNPGAQVQIPPPVAPPVQVAGPGAGDGPVPPPLPPPANVGPLDAASREAYRAAHPFSPPPQQAATFSTQVDPTIAANMARQEQNASNLVEELKKQYQATGDVKLVTDIANATDKYNTTVGQNNTTRQAQIKEGNTAYNAALAAHNAALDASWDKAHELQQTQQGQLANAQKTDDMTAGRKVTDTMDAAAVKASNMNSGLTQMFPVLDKLPQGLTAAVLQAHPEWLGGLKTAGLVSSDTADAVQMINGLTSYMSTQMKPAGLGSMREYEFDAFRAALPGLLKSPDGQRTALAMLLNMNDRIIQESQWMRGHFQRLTNPSDPNSKAYNLAPDNFTQMDKALGPIIQHYTGNPGDPVALRDYRAQQIPGRPYYDIGYRQNRDGTPMLDAGGKVMYRQYPKVAPMPTDTQ